MVRKYTKEELITFLTDYFEAAPEAAKEIFFYAMLSCVQPFVKHSFEGVVVCIGRRATMKTTTTRVVTDGEIKFQSIKNFTEDYNACNLEKKKIVLIDDVFPKIMQYSELKQAELLNKIVRFGDRKIANVGLIITMEYLPKLLPSGRDRVWVTKFPLLRGTLEEIEGKWKRLATLPAFMEELMWMYQEVLEEKREKVQNYIESYLEQYKLPEDLTYETRIPIHMKNLLLSEEVFHTHFLEGNSVQCYDRQEYKERVIRSAYTQQQEVFDSENATDLVKATYHIFASGKFLSKCSYEEYFPNGKNYTLIRGEDFIMVSNATLLGAINEYLNRTISRSVLNKALTEAGVVEKEGDSPTKSTSKYGCRHFYINYPALCKYMELNYYHSDDTNDMIVDVIRKK